MQYEELLIEFLSDCPEYGECIEYHADETLIDWYGLRVFLFWLQCNDRISDAVFERGDELLRVLETGEAQEA